MWVSRRLRFGRFISCSYAHGREKIPLNLSERRFREFWEQHSTGRSVQAGSHAEQKRFQAILDSEDWQVRIGGKAPFPVGERVAEFENGLQRGSLGFFVNRGLQKTLKTAQP